MRERISSSAPGGSADGRGGGVASLAVEFDAADAVDRYAAEVLPPRNNASVSTPWSTGMPPTLALGDGVVVEVEVDVVASFSLFILSFAATANGMTRAHT